MLETIRGFFKKIGKKEEEESNSKDAAKERLHLVLLQDRANVSVDFLDLMKQEIIDVIKKYIEIDESEIDVRLTNKINEDGTNGAPALYANIPIVSIKSEKRTENKKINNKKNEIENFGKNDTEKHTTTEESKNNKLKQNKNEESDKIKKEVKEVKEVKKIEKKATPEGEKKATTKKSVVKKEIKPETKNTRKKVSTSNTVKKATTTKTTTSKK